MKEKNNKSEEIILNGCVTINDKLEVKFDFTKVKELFKKVMHYELLKKQIKIGNHNIIYEAVGYYAGEFSSWSGGGEKYVIYLLYIYVKKGKKEHPLITIKKDDDFKSNYDLTIKINTQPLLDE